MLTTRPAGLGVMIDGRTQSDVTPAERPPAGGRSRGSGDQWGEPQTFPVTIKDNQIITQSVNWEQ